MPQPSRARRSAELCPCPRWLQGCSVTKDDSWERHLRSTMDEWQAQAPPPPPPPPGTKAPAAAAKGQEKDRGKAAAGALERHAAEQDKVGGRAG